MRTIRMGRSIGMRHLALLVATIVSHGTLRSQPIDTARAHSIIDRWEPGVEGFVPTQDHRSIGTFNMNGSARIALWRSIGLYVHGGLTATYAWGDIRQDVESGGDTILQNSAAGIGPFFRLQWEPITIGRFSFSFSVGEGILLYSERFPAGGDIYNAILRIGGEMTVRVSDDFFVGVGYRWMHVSNGQGLGPHNPAYEGRGVAVCVTVKK